MLSTIVNTLKDIRNFLILLMIFMFAYTLVGVEFFAYRIKFNDDDEYDLVNGVSPRINFDGFANSLFAVFITIQTNQWNVLMYNIGRSVGKAGMIFSIVLVVIGQIILLKLFIAILLENFEDKRKEMEAKRII